MARPLRIEFAGATYHVMARGNEKRAIVRNDADRRAFLISLDRMTRRFPVDLHAFALMRNHYHLLLETRDACLAACMQWLNSDYVIKFNQRHGRVGHLFQGRYKAFILGDDGYFQLVADYIHLNPLRAGEEALLGRYPWTSFEDYARKVASHGFVSRSRLLALLAQEARSPFSAFRRRLQRRTGTEGKFVKDVKKGFIFGDEAFVEKMRLRVPKEPLSDVPQHGWLIGTAPSDRALGDLLGVVAVDPSRILHSRRGRRNPDRDRAMYVLSQHAGIPLVRIGAFFGVSGAAVSMALARVETSASANPDVRRTLEKAGRALRKAASRF